MPSVRSRVSNGKQAFVHGNGRTRWARRYRDLVEVHVNDLGGRDAVTEVQAGLCRRIATLECVCEKMEGQLSLGEEIDVDLLNRTCGTLKRLYETLRLKEGSRSATPDLDSYLATRRKTPPIEVDE